MTIGTGATATSDSRWSERNIRYDLDGNILHLERYQGNANTPQATLDFSYDGPKRNGYSYDSNGNITYDPLRCFEIRYNLLNLAAEVIGHDPEDTAAEGTLLCETVYYADGTRSGVRLPNDGPWLTRYVSSLICDGDSEFLYPMGVVSDFGYIDLQSGKMQYFLRDHLGSVRVIAEDRHTVISRTDYLPFGVRMSGDGLTVGNPSARSSFFGFSGKENEMWGGYDTADGDITPHWLKGERYQHFGARAYDPVSCIFMQVDPMAEKYYGMTPYGYCAGNPVMMMDPDGKKIVVGSFFGRIMASLGFNNFENKVQKHIQELKNVDSSLHTSITRIEDSDKQYYIQPVNKRIDGRSGNGYYRPTHTLFYNPDSNTTQSGKNRDAIVGLAHEFGHMDDDANGVSVEKVNMKKISAGDKTEINKLEKREQNALKFENIVRAHLGIELRTRYYEANTK